tara:strand:- start:901 stop:1788 length:888 start_codon:yes stop_codon:yes gene_type:complete
LYQGFLNLNKPSGISSNKVLNILKPHVNGSKIGFIGTLDPLASGVLPICIGFATRISEFVSDEVKEYELEGVFGISTNTFDAEGEINSKSNFDHVTEEDLNSLLEEFKLKYIQEAPIFSALKVNGNKMYDLARQGIEVNPKKRVVKLYDFEIIHFEKPNFRIKILCSKGFYVRSLVNDIGIKLGTHAYLYSLVRTKSSGFSINTSYDIDEIKYQIQNGNIDKLITPIDELLKNAFAVNLDEIKAKKILNGNKLEMSIKEIKNNERLLIYDNKSSLIAIGEYLNGYIIPLKVVPHD